MPTIILTNKKGEVGSITGTPSIRKYVKIVYEMLGEEPPLAEEEKEHKPGILDRLFGRGSQ